jgi:rhomboid protease GluP
VETKTVLKETYLSRKPRKRSFDFSLLLLAILTLATFAYLNGIAGADRWMAASWDLAVTHHEYWRVFTTLFAHADLGHLLANAFLFLPFSYFLSGYYPRWFFPGLGFALCGLLNFVVLATMPPAVFLVGVSGVVYWMGAAWLTLYLLIERRDPPRRRFGKAIIVTAALFLPDTVKPEVSYLSHYLGFLAGTISGFAFYFLRREEIRGADRFEVQMIEDGIGEDEWNPPETLT